VKGMANRMIEVDSLTKQRAGRPVLDAVSLRGTEAGVTVLVGASGSGKSTLLRCLNGLEIFEGAPSRSPATGSPPAVSPPWGSMTCGGMSAWCFSSSTSFRISPCSTT